MRRFAIITAGLFLAAALGLGTYLVFFMDVEGRSLAGHSADIWQSTPVQRKIERVSSSLKRKVMSQLENLTGSTESERANPAAAGARNANRADNPQPSPHRVSEADRKALEKLIANSP